MFATYEPRSRDVPCIHKAPAKESNAEGDLVRRLQAGNHAGFSDFVDINPRSAGLLMASSEIATMRTT